MSQDSSDWISPDDLVGIETTLRQSNWIATDEKITDVERAGEGNMNLTLRVTTERRTLIVKQSRPWVEKYPTIDAPVERATYERRFYLAIQDDPVLNQRMPRVLGYNEETYLLVLEDLGPSKDCSSLYSAAENVDTQISAAIEQLVPWLARLHDLELDNIQRRDLQNVELRKLNHEYIFILPFATPPSIDLETITPGLEQIAAPLRGNEALKSVAAKLGQQYLATGNCLIHGDFFPGSWLQTENGIQVIDPEFCHCGLAEFDLGVMIAHLRMTLAEQDYTDAVRQTYARATQVDWDLIEQFTSIEVLRRLLGLAQLPLQIDLEQKNRLINSAVQFLLK